MYVQRCYCYTAFMRTIVALIIFLLANQPLAHATPGYFEDVFVSTPYALEINKLAEEGIVNGEPDGYFYPNRSVNRAEMLKILYEAGGKLALRPSRACFTDVDVLAWYAPYVCDAKENGFIEGYTDGTFAPAQTVNTVEALKMLHTVLGLETVLYPQPLPVADVEAAAWYMPYVVSAYAQDILPIATQSANRLEPAAFVERAEMVAYVYNAVFAKADVASQQSSSSSITSSSSVSSRSQERVSSASATFNPTALDIQWEQSGTFTASKPVTYSFTVDSSVGIKAIVTQNTNAQIAPRCTLYKFEPNGFSYEFYYGHTETRSCSVVAELQPGTYQFQMIPGIPDVTYSAAISPAETDGNDNFAQALNLKFTPITQTIEINNTHDWYAFTLEYPANQIVTLTNEAQAQCDIYGLEDVDFDGPNRPVCNQSMLYPAGSYIVGIRRKNTSVNQSVRYTISRNRVAN